MELVIATKNFHKSHELKAMIRSHFKGIEVLTLRDFPDYEMPDEVGESFQEIAELKAVHAAKAIGKYVIADDSGLVVPALNGEPGIYSKRYAGLNATDKENLDKLIAKLKTLTEESRHAYFECALAIATPEGISKIFKGITEGELILEPRGRNGFGYDPIFIKHNYKKTFAELEEDVKNRISHRRKAFDRLIPHLESELLKVTISS
jgi:XTP/dITP diphosphohydrolase